MRSWGMRIAPLLLTTALLGAVPAIPLRPAEPGWAQDLRERLEAPRFAGARWGIQVLSLDSGRVLFEQDAGKFFTPASTAKLFPAALALATLGPELRIRTSLYASRPPGPDGVLAGDLILYGRGDPLMLAPWRGGAGRPDPLEALAGQLRAAGVRTVAGDVVGDDSFFATLPYGPGWEAGDLARPFGAEPSALTLHDNMVDLWVYPGSGPGRPCLVFPMPGLGLLPVDNRTTTAVGPGQGVAVDRALGDATLRVTGSLAPGAGPTRLAVSIREPARFFAQLLHRALQRQGITVRGGVRAVHARDRAGAPLAVARLTELAHLDSPPLAEVVRVALKESNNLYAQLLLLQAGAAAGSGDGLAALQAFLAGAGIAPGDVLLEEGAGLSRKDLVKPRALVQLLAHMARGPQAGPFLAALPLAGIDGTLARRLDTGAALGNLRAKTGSMRNTQALAGTLTTAGGDHLVFAIMLNQYPGAGPGAPSPHEEVDAIAGTLAALP